MKVKTRDKSALVYKCKFLKFTGQLAQNLVYRCNIPNLGAKRKFYSKSGDNGCMDEDGDGDGDGDENGECEKVNG